MKKNLHLRSFFLMLFAIFLWSGTAIAQTPGLIYSPATSGGAKILDPNGDGYVSRTASGFSGTSDEGASFSEIPYRPFPALLTEPLGDLNTGSAGGHTDLAPPATPTTAPSTGSPINAFFDGTNLMFRIRLGGASTASKGYSVLIDSDGKFEGTGTNPGFEYEVLLASNFAVQVIQHGPTGSSTIFSGSVTQYSQKAVAASTSGGNPDYFYDYYVPLSAFKGGITASTPLRMSGITITSAQSGLTGTVSDVGGVNFQAYNYDAPAAWRALIGSFPATSLTAIQTTGFPQIAAVAPVVTGPILANSTSISGTSVEAPGSVVTVYRNGTAICGGTAQPTCPTVTANGTWTITGISSTLLTAGNTITATISAPNKTVSTVSNTVTVSTGLCIATPAPVLTGLGSSGNTSRSFIGTTSYVGTQRITIYNANTNLPVAGTATAPNPFVFTAQTSGSTWTSPIYTLGEFNYYATVTPIDASGNVIGCESIRSNQLCFKNGNPTINNHQVAISNVVYDGITFTSASSPTWSEIPTNFTSISGSVTLNGNNNTGFVTIFLNGAATAEKVSFTTTNLNWTITPSTSFLASLKPGDQLSVRTEFSTTSGNTTICTNVYSSRSNLLTIQATTSAPTITAPKCGFVTTLSGTSSEAAGTVLQFYTGGTAGQRNGTLITQSGTTTPITATVQTTGNWTVDLSGAAGGGISAGTAITARAKAPGKVRSVNSLPVQSAPAPAGTITIIGPITEGQTTIAGTAPANSIVTLYVEGSPYNPVTANSNGNFVLEGFNPLEIFAGAAITASFRTSETGCESAKTAPLIVQCVPPSSGPTVSPTASTVCVGSSATVTVGNSERGVAYRLVTESGTSPNFTYTETGSSVLGTGGTITLTSGPITAATTLRVRARKINGAACEVLLGRVSVSVNPLPPNNYGVTINSASGCAGASPVITVSSAQPGYRYELINDATKELVLTTSGSPNPRTGPTTTGPISFTVASVSATTTYGIRIVNTTQNNTSCAVENAIKVTYTVAGPRTDQAVRISTTRTCPGGAAVIYVDTNNDGATYKLFQANGSGGGTEITGTGTPVIGDGTTKSVTVSPATTGLHTYYFTASANNCTVSLTNRVTLEISDAGRSVSAGAEQTVCGSTVTLQGSDPAPGTGIWSVSTATEGTNANPTFADVNSATTTVSGLTSGTYVFTWTVTTPACGPKSANTTVIINCPTTYNIAPPRYVNQYSVNSLLATATDTDKLPSSPASANGVREAGVVSGTTLPPGTGLLGNGNVIVTDPSALVPGTYTFSVFTIDQRGGTTTTSLTIIIYGPEPTITPLPVELVYFTGTVQNGKVNLKWLTASEEDNEKFEVERSTDGKTFEQIGTVAGAGTTVQEQRYSFTDAQPLTGVVYYRLKQVDFSGEFAYSNVIAVSLKGVEALAQLQVWPNPFEREINLTVTAPTAGEASVSLVDMRGQEVYRGKVQLQPGVNELNLPIRGLSTGMYILRLQGNDVSGTAKIMKR